MTWTGLRRENLKRKTEPLLLAAQNNAIKTYVEAESDRAQNNKGR